MSVKQRIKESVVYGTYGEDEFLLVKESGELLIVGGDYFGESADVLFTVGHPFTDLPDDELLNRAKQVVNFLNRESKEREE